MRALFDPDPDTVDDEAEVAAFRRGLASVNKDHRRILMILIPKLAALQDRGDSAGALGLIATIRALVTREEGRLN